MNLISSWPPKQKFYFPSGQGDNKLGFFKLLIKNQVLATTKTKLQDDENGRWGK